MKAQDLMTIDYYIRVKSKRAGKEILAGMSGLVSLTGYLAEEMLKKSQVTMDGDLGDGLYFTIVAKHLSKIELFIYDDKMPFIHPLISSMALEYAHASKCIKDKAIEIKLTRDGEIYTRPARVKRSRK